ncbi:tetratricopeptide repeat protein [Pseudoneobacillus sp. C159]
MSENQLIQKRYYENYIKDNELAHPIRVLGECFITEQSTEVPDLTTIRFAQGEVYFHHKDFETAIFKWEHIQNELEPWAKKNMADALVQLKLFKEAEERYKSIISDSVLLNTEIGLQLFSLYSLLEQMDSAFKVIKKVVSLNPNYSNVTKIALDFFVSQKDWLSAAELAASEALRTESMSWFDHLKDYVKDGYTEGLAPSFFMNVLKRLYKLDRHRFEELITILSESYRNDLAWVTVMNELFAELVEDGQTSSPKIAYLFKDTYHHLLNGQYLLSQLNRVIPLFLSNWFKITQSHFAASAILAWKDLFPTSLESETVNEAEYHFHNNKGQQLSEKEIFPLFELILNWAETNGIIQHEGMLDVEGTQLYSETEPVEKLISTMRKVITELSEKRIEVENRLVDSISSLEEILTKLNGANHQLQDLQDEKMKTIKKVFFESKDIVKSELIKRIPKLLQECAEVIKDDSDFGKINNVLNEEMNRRVQQYIEEKILPDYYESLKYWLDFSKEELETCQAWLHDRRDGFHVLLDKKLPLDCDFTIIEDWHRDIKRMTSGTSIDELNVLRKFKTTQFLISNAGKLLSAFTKNSLLSSKYRTLIETDDFKEVTDEMIAKFLVQFNLFEKGLDRDLKLFFKQPYEVLSQKMDEIKQLKRTDETTLLEHQENPEIVRDPITIFELRLRQFEWMLLVENSPVYE